MIWYWSRLTYTFHCTISFNPFDCPNRNIWGQLNHCCNLYHLTILPWNYSLKGNSKFSMLHIVMHCMNLRKRLNFRFGYVSSFQFKLHIHVFRQQTESSEHNLSKPTESFVETMIIVSTTNDSVGLLRLRRSLSVLYEIFFLAHWLYFSKSECENMCL